MSTPAWPPSDSVPPLHQRDGMALSSAQIAELLRLLRQDLPPPVRPSVEDPHPSQPWRKAALPEALRTQLDTVRDRCGESALDAWMAQLVRAWLQIGTGTARKLRWVVPAAAVLGGDACAALLGPHLRSENYDLRCTGEVGVEALVDIGTRSALLELAHLARKCPARTRGALAQQALQQIADAQGLTPDQLQDRILPDGGLDAEGRRLFDYGPRQFALVLDAQLTPTLRAPDGRALTSLPKPTRKDDAVLASEARHVWKMAKGQIQQTARSLATRFEAAMIGGETWSVAEFNDYFRRHPLARHVVQRLLWRSAEADAEAATCFRVAEDDTLADVDDAEIQLSSTTVRVRPIHPLELRPMQLQAWQHRFAEYQIVSPFPQLDRTVFRITDAPADLKLFTSFPNDQMDVKSVVFALENRGWMRGEAGDGGMVTRHCREFRRPQLVACLEYTPGAFLGDLLASGVQTLTQLYVVRLGDPVCANRALPLRETPAIVLSETLRDIHALRPAA